MAGWTQKYLNAPNGPQARKPDRTPATTRPSGRMSENFVRRTECGKKEWWTRRGSNPRPTD